MPRGSRAIHGGEVTLSAHPHSVEELVAISPDCDVLETECWGHCTTLWVPQVEVSRCVTRSCGRPRCVGPAGQRELGYRSPNEVKAMRRANLRSEIVIHVRVRQPNDTVSAEAREVRRELVAEQWRLGCSIRLIAERLRLPVHTVSNDFTLMRKRGRI